VEQGVIVEMAARVPDDGVEDGAVEEATRGLGIDDGQVVGRQFAGASKLVPVPGTDGRAGGDESSPFAGSRPSVEPPEGEAAGAPEFREAQPGHLDAAESRRIRARPFALRGVPGAVDRIGDESRLRLHVLDVGRLEADHASAASAD
jgi:hypothetical protein